MLTLMCCTCSCPRSACWTYGSRATGKCTRKLEVPSNTCSLAVSLVLPVQGHPSMGAGPSNSGVRMSTPVQASGAPQSSNLSQVVSGLTGRGLDVNVVDPDNKYKQSILQIAVQVSNYNLCNERHMFFYLLPET